MEETLLGKKNGEALYDLLKAIAEKPNKSFSYYCHSLNINQTSFFRYIKTLRNEDLIEQQAYKVTNRYKPSPNLNKGYPVVYEVPLSDNKWQRLAIQLASLNDNDLVKGFTYKGKTVTKKELLSWIFSSLKQLDVLDLGLEYFAKCSLLTNDLDAYKTPKEFNLIPHSITAPLTKEDFDELL